MTEFAPTFAREYWKALVDNASRLVGDAQLLMTAGSHARARSLVVLAQEELGKAVWVYNQFANDWSNGAAAPRDVPELTQHSRSHIEKYMSAYVYGDELAEFWGDYSAWTDYPTTEAEIMQRIADDNVKAKASAVAANIAKQNGFYVDVLGQTISAPARLADTGVETEISRAAKVVEMLLIRDHTRMKHDAQTPYDSTHEQQWRLLPMSHPEEFGAASLSDEAPAT